MWLVEQKAALTACPSDQVRAKKELKRLDPQYSLINLPTHVLLWLLWQNLDDADKSFTVDEIKSLQKDAAEDGRNQLACASSGVIIAETVVYRPSFIAQEGSKDAEYSLWYFVDISDAGVPCLAAYLRTKNSP
jgi:hypothetical protein